jgi:hypothetical protein
MHYVKMLYLYARLMVLTSNTVEAFFYKINYCLPTKQHPESLFVERSLGIFRLLQQRRILFTRTGYLLHQQDTCYIDRTLGTLTGHFVTLIGRVLC